MVEEIIIFSSDPFIERGDLLAVFGDKTESSKLMKSLFSQFQKINEDGVYEYFENNKKTTILFAEIDLYLQSRQYEEIYYSFIFNVCRLYGNTIVFGLPEGENLQSIAMGFMNSCKKFMKEYDKSGEVIEKKVFKVYVEESFINILKPLHDKLSKRLKRKKAIGEYLLKRFSCSECYKFCYMPFEKKCCGKMICSRCGHRDASTCSTCSVEIDNLKSAESFKNLCENAPYICNCGKLLPFIDITGHINNCPFSEVECKICNEMTKLCNFIAHIRMSHKDRIRKDIEIL
jgi:hypothetical protein